MAISDFQSPFLLLESRDETIVATVTRPSLSEEENIDIWGKDLLDLVDQYGCKQIVVSLENVTYITSAALGKLITLHRKLHRKDGRLVVCGILAGVDDVLQTSRLNDYFTIAPDIPAAMTMMAVPLADENRNLKTG
jgi:anti-sigma B factor antagonist